MVNNLLEVAGFVLLVVFAWFVWPPAAALVAGLILIVVANMRAAKRRPAGPRFTDRLARVLAAYRAGGSP